MEINQTAKTSCRETTTTTTIICRSRPYRARHLTGNGFPKAKKPESSTLTHRETKRISFSRLVSKEKETEKQKKKTSTTFRVMLRLCYKYIRSTSVSKNKKMFDWLEK